MANEEPHLAASTDGPLSPSPPSEPSTPRTSLDRPQGMISPPAVEVQAPPVQPLSNNGDAPLPGTTPDPPRSSFSSSNSPRASLDNQDTPPVAPSSASSLPTPAPPSAASFSQTGAASDEGDADEEDEEDDRKALLAQLAQTRDEKATLEKQYRALVAKVGTMRDTLGKKLREDAVRTLSARYSVPFGFESILTTGDVDWDAGGAGPTRDAAARSWDGEHAPGSAGLNTRAGTRFTGGRDE